MKPVQRFFLSVLSDLCHNQTSYENEVPDPDSLYILSESHSLASIVYNQLTLSFHKNFRSCFLSDAFCSVNRADMLKEIASAFSKEDIPFICMKGSVFRDYYPVPELRSMGDVDLIIHPEDRNRVDRIMTEGLGYSRFVDHQDVWAYYIEQFEFEIHTHMFYDPLANNIDYRSYFDHVWEHVHMAPVFGFESSNMYVPDISFHFLYLMTHTAKHIINKGSGFRAYLDMVMMCRACNNTEEEQNQLDWKWITKELEKLQLLTFTKTCFSLCERWFEVDMPLEKEPLDDAFFELITEKTFNDGIFGIENEENEGAWTARDIKREIERGGSYRKGAVKLLIKKIFPAYRDMQLVPWYKFVAGRPWLLPIAWVYRWWYCLRHKSGQSRELITEPFVKKKEIEERERLIRALGL